MKNIPDLQALLVTNIQKETDDYVSIFFVKPKGFNFAPGDCFDLLFMEKDFSEGRIFSFSSSPTEEHLRVTFRKGISEYKKRLEKIKPGDTLYLNNFGSQYVFFLDRPLLFYAGGIGISIFRSIIKFAVDKNLKPSFTLIYSNRTENFVFKEELDNWANILKMQIHYLTTQKQGRLNNEKLVEFIPNINEKKYIHYVVGPPAMIDSTNEILTSLGIDEEHIHTDSFDGYYGEDE